MLDVQTLTVKCARKNLKKINLTSVYELIKNNLYYLTMYSKTSKTCIIIVNINFKG